jgi:hypothetical protein
MITVKDAVNSALSYVREFRSILPDQDVRLGETELGEENGRPVWLVARLA